MISFFKYVFKNNEWLLFFGVCLLTLAGIVTMNSFVGDSGLYQRQLIWFFLSIAVFFVASAVDWRFLRQTKIIVSLFGISILVLFSLFILGNVVKGSKSWFDLGFFAFQPSDPIKLIVILILAKYFSRRHIEIANIRHILVSGFYIFSIFLLVFLQPDFGSAIIIFFIWLGMVLVSGISKKHILAVFLVGIVSFGFLWGFVFKDYQKNRIRTFVDPLTDIQGSGYNAYQSMVAVGSGQILGKGIGYGTQSKLRFLPEYQTDFIFAAFTEEWGFIGALLIFVIFGIVFWRILNISMRGDTNFEILFGLGLAILFFVHGVIHVGMNIGLLPVTGITLPFMSYGGSHLVTEFLGLGILVGMKRYSRTTHKDLVYNEMVGI
ncbi:MAG: rod shape-determining protein RodA [Candidatus Paceibacterota bacterium]